MFIICSKHNFKVDNKSFDDVCQFGIFQNILECFRQAI